MTLSLFNELKRRNVIRVGIAYLAVAWLIIQVAETIFPLFGFGDGPARLVVIILVIGFVPALVFAWAFQLTTEGLKKDEGEGEDTHKTVPAHAGKKMDRAIFVVLAVALAYFAFDKFMLDPRRDEAKLELAAERAVEQAIAQSHAALSEQSIAVLPFTNRSANDENAGFFSDGVHDELLFNLSRIEKLKVISRTSVMNYRDTAKNLRQIAQELGVTKIIEGGVQRSGDMVRINVQLIDAFTDDHLWAEIYDRQLSVQNVFEVQTEIAVAIADALKASLTPGEQVLIAQTPTRNLEAFDNFLLARQLLDRNNNVDLWNAKTHAEEAVRLDPEYSDAWVLLARIYHNLVHKSAVLPREVADPWMEAVETAIALNENSAGAQAVQAQYLQMYGLDGVDERFEKALDLEPGNAEIMVMYANYLRRNFRFEEALQLFQSARERDPLSLQLLFGMARIYELRRESEKALELYARIRQIDPSSSLGFSSVIGVYASVGNLVQSLQWAFRTLAMDHEDSDLANFIASFYLDLGETERARHWLAMNEHSANTSSLTLATQAKVDVYDDNREHALDLARKVVEIQLPDRWGSYAIVTRTLLIQAKDENSPDSALELTLRLFPEFLDEHPAIDAGNVMEAIDTAHLFQMASQSANSENLLRAVVELFETPHAATEPWMDTGKAQALALLGDREAALEELGLRIDSGWRIQWRWETELNPNFQSLWNDPEFQAMVDIIRSDIDRQYEELQALESTGEIPRVQEMRSAVD